MPVIRLIFLICLAALASTAVAADRISFQEDLTALCAGPNRIIGGKDYLTNLRYIEQQCGKISGVEVRRQDFGLMTPQTHSAGVTLADGTTGAVYPIYPASVRLNATPAAGISGKLVYCGSAELNEIPAKDVAGQIAVIEASAGMRWQQLEQFDPAAVIVLGSDATTHVDLRSHDLLLAANFPRFYVPPGAFADSLRKGRATATLKVSADWMPTVATNLFAFVPGKTPAGWTQQQAPAALMIVVPIDASSLVPDLSPGAGQAVQTAGALTLLRKFVAEPIDRPVVFCFTSADSVNFLGTRTALQAVGEAPTRWDEELNDRKTQHEELLTEVTRIAALKDHPETINLRADHPLVSRLTKMIESDIAAAEDELFRLRAAPPGSLDASDAARLPQLEAQQSRLNELKFAFGQMPSELAVDDLKPAAVEYLSRTLERMDNHSGGGLIAEQQARIDQLQQRQAIYRWLADKEHRNANPAANDTSQRPIEAMISLDLSDGGTRAGPMFYGQYLRTSGIGDLQAYREWFGKLDKSSGWFAKLNGAIDPEPFLQLRSPQSYIAAPLPLPSELASPFAMPGFSLITLDDLRPRRDTPNDTLDRLRIDNILPQLDGVEQVLRHAAADPKFVGPTQLKRSRNAFSGQVVSAASGRPVPDLPRPGFLATYYYTLSVSRRTPQLRDVPWTLGVRRNEMQACDAEGNYRFEGFPKLESGNAREYYFLAAEVFHSEPGTGVIDGCSDLGKVSGDMRPYADLRTDQQPIRSLAMNCEEFSLAGLYDPRYLQTLTDGETLDARRNAETQRSNFMISNQLVSGFVEPGTKLELLFRYGRIGNRLVLLNMPATHDATMTGRGEGFTAPQLRDLGPLSLATSVDFWRLDDQRLADYRAAGVSNNLLDELHAKAADQIKAAQTALDQNDSAKAASQASGAWSNEARVYSAAQDMAHDVVHAAIFLLLLCVPFSFCMERLLIGTPNVYKQIGGIAAIFAIMTAALWSFHPAFKISTSPLIVILSFAIILMSLLVISVVYGKFDTELKRISSGRGTAAANNLARASVLGSAVLLGIANMRKRKFRTLLTSITIVLITFAVLCFTSSARLLDTTSIPIGVATSHSGVLLRQRGFRPIPVSLRDGLAPTVAAAVGNRPIVERWWNVKPADPNEVIDVSVHDAVGNRTLAVSAALGLMSGESNASNIASVIGPSFAALEDGVKDVCYLSRSSAVTLKIKPGDSVTVGGVPLKLAGAFDGDRFDNEVRTLAGEQITPLKYTSGGLDASGRPLSDLDPTANSSESFELNAESSASEAGGNYEHLSSNRIVIVPVAVSQMLQNATLRDISIRVENQDQVKQLTDELCRRFALALYGGFDDGVRLVSASNLASVSGAGQVAIPLAIAGLIIFNTMMGSIAERRREIHVYTSLGLAPLHVGALFVAEALTYGLIGAVFGYIIGQGAGTALSKLGWLGNVTLNYSGTSAMITMGLILVIVLLSAIVPARLASKIAAPSIDRTWKVPQPHGDVISAELPFTINRSAAEGALAYLAEFFQEHQEGSIGKFSAGTIEPITKVDEQQRIARGLKTNVWLTPFDLGVRQELQLVIHPGEFPDIYEVQVLLHRQSGDDGSWYRMNRSFLTELRKQFLQWRSLTPQRMAEYIAESRRLFSSDQTAAASQ